MSKDLLKDYVDNFIKNSDDVDTLNLSEYLKFSAKKIVSEIRGTNELVEFTADSAIKFNGDEVLVNGKPVGTVINDPNDLQNDVVFISNNGNKKSFPDLESLYNYIATSFNVTENTMTQGLNTKIDEPKDLNVGDGLNDFCLDKNADTSKSLPSPNDEEAQVSLTPRVKKLKALADKIHNAGRVTSTKVTETKFEVSPDGNKVEKIKKQVKKFKDQADLNGNK